MIESSILAVFKSLHCPRRKETAPKAGTAGFSSVPENLSTAYLCADSLGRLSAASQKLNGIATNAAEQRIDQLIQNSGIEGIQKTTLKHPIKLGVFLMI